MLLKIIFKKSVRLSRTATSIYVSMRGSHEKLERSGMSITRVLPLHSQFIAHILLTGKARQGKTSLTSLVFPTSHLLASARYKLNVSYSTISLLKLDEKHLATGRGMPGEKHGVSSR